MGKQNIESALFCVGTEPISLCLDYYFFPLWMQ
jgi:hypothetical protein